MSLLLKLVKAVRDTLVEHFDDTVVAVCRSCWEKYGRPPALLYHGQKLEYSCRYCSETTKEPVFLDRLRTA